MFPTICGACTHILHPRESFLCTHCLHNIAQYPVELQQPAFESLLYGRVNFEQARCLFYFQKHGASQEVIHNLKYRNQSQLSGFFGDWMGELLKDSKHFQSVDAVIPVPLHPKRLRKRGYNQVEGFGRGIAKHLQADYIDHVLLRRSNSKTQVFKNRMARTEMIENSFYISSTQTLKEKHLLLVDDLATTGATLESCYLALKPIPDFKLSLATMALNR